MMLHVSVNFFYHVFFQSVFGTARETVERAALYVCLVGLEWSDYQFLLASFDILLPLESET